MSAVGMDLTFGEPSLIVSSHTDLELDLLGPMQEVAEMMCIEASNNSDSFDQFYVVKIEEKLK